MMKYGGLTEEEALKLITWNPAWQLGIQDRVGSIEAGKDADLAIWTGHPLSTMSRVETTFVDGEIFFDRQQDLARRTALESERKALEAMEPNKAPSEGGTAPAAPRGRPTRASDAHDDDIDEEGVRP
jgi:adenine deaminase